MNVKLPAILPLLACASLFGQDQTYPERIYRVQEQAYKAQLDAERVQGDQLRLGKELSLALQQPPQPPQPAQPPEHTSKRMILGSDSGQYDIGARLLDDRKYDEAIPHFDRVIASKQDRADGALYWKAYALNRIGRRDEALAALATLRQNYPQSHWLNDAQVLEAEVKQNAGRPVSPGDENNDDIKLMAINSLMRADPDRAIPLLENLLKSGSSPRLKDRALFVLTQSKSPKAEQILADYAKGAGNPDLQLRAVRYIGVSGTAESQQQLAAIYASSNDTAVKREILRSLGAAGARDQLFNAAKNEKDAGLRAEAIRQLGAMRAVDQLARLYTPDSAPEVKTEIVRALMVSGASDRLLELVRSEKDQNVRAEAIRSLAVTKSTTAETLVGMYTADTDARTKRELVNGLFVRGDAKQLVELARKESDPAMKKYIVQELSQMNSKEATDYMMELLK
jgi:tetratricopeptide (TPR) repeat protein